MKKLSIIIAVLCCFVLVGQIYAQETVPKEILLNTLNSVNSMKKLSNDTTLKLMEYNKGYVDKVYEIIDSNKSDKEIKDAFKSLSAENEKSLIELFGKKGIYKDYVKLMEEELHPLIKEDKHLKYLY